VCNETSDGSSASLADEIIGEQYHNAIDAYTILITGLISVQKSHRRFKARNTRYKTEKEQSAKINARVEIKILHGLHGH